jgi:predicted deacetylase
VQQRHQDVLLVALGHHRAQHDSGHSETLSEREGEGDELSVVATQRGG